MIYNEQQFFWIPRNHSNNNDDEKHDGNHYKSLLNTINHKYHVNIEDIELKIQSAIGTDTIDIDDSDILESEWTKLKQASITDDISKHETEIKVYIIHDID